jgi:hypothetical protein
MIISLNYMLYYNQANCIILKLNYSFTVYRFFSNFLNQKYIKKKKKKNQ